MAEKTWPLLLRIPTTSTWMTFSRGHGTDFQQRTHVLGDPVRIKLTAVAGRKKEFDTIRCRFPNAQHQSIRLDLANYGLRAAVSRPKQHRGVGPGLVPCCLSVNSAQQVLPWFLDTLPDKLHQRLIHLVGVGPRNPVRPALDHH